MAAFEDTFKDYNPKSIQFSAYKADLENTNELDFHIRLYKEEVERIERLKEKGAQIALLVKNQDGSQRLVIGRVDYTKIFHGRPKVKTRQVPNPRTGWFEPKTIEQTYTDENDLHGGDVVEFFVITASDGKVERVPYKSVLRYTSIDLRVRTLLFAKEFKEFDPADAGYDSVDLDKSIEDHVHYMGTNSTWMSSRYHNAMAVFNKKKPLAFLVQRKDGSQHLVAGTPEPILGEVKGRSNILIKLRVKRIDNGQTEELSPQDILNYTQKSVRNHSGVDILTLAKLFEAMPTPASPPNIQDFARMTIHDALNLTQQESALQVAKMNTLEKLKFVKQLLGYSLNSLQKEALLQAILIGNLPTTYEEVGQVSAGRSSYSPTIVEAKYRSLKNAQFTHEEILRIAQSGVLGVLQLN